MAPSLRFSSLVLLAMSWMLAAGCGDDDTTTLATGGSSGTAGTAAHAGSSGTHPSAAGAAGSSGSSGAAGSSGTDAGGAAGEGGELTSTGATSGGATSGGATSGGATSGGATSGGTGGATAGTGGTGGATAGTGGTAGAANSVKNCAYQCATDDDCKVNGTDQGFSCNPISKRCEDVSACQVSSDCVAFANQFNWYVPCADDTGCSGTEACVAVGGGLCAPLPDPQTGCADGVLTQLAHFGATGNVQVCATPGVCVNKTCQVSCVDPINGACSNDGTQCNTGTGLCECSASTECMVAGKPVCGADSHCGCTTSAQCSTTASVGLDTCYSGSCGCSSASVCPDLGFKNVTAVCE